MSNQILEKITKNFGSIPAVGGITRTSADGGLGKAPKLGAAAICSLIFLYYLVIIK